MSYLDQTSRNRPKTIAAVVLLHAGLGYVIVSGLAYQVIKYVPRITPTEIYPETQPPPPHDALPPPPNKAQNKPLPEATDPIVKVNPTNINDVDIVRVETQKAVAVDPPPTIVEHVLPLPKPNLGRAVEPGVGRAGWVTSDDYPPGLLRDGVTGTVGITVAIAIDGRVQGCEVTKSSGNSQLDEATCRLYTRRARFKPALDAEGRPAIARFADRIRWELPPQ